MQNCAATKWRWTGVVLGFVLLMGGVEPARALNVEGVQVDDRATVGNRSLLLNGAGVRRFWLFDMYVAALYVPEPITNAAGVLDRDIPKEVSITLLHEVSADNNVDLLTRGLEANNSPQTLNAIRDDMQRFLGLVRQTGTFPKGSVIHLDYLPGTGTEVWLNHRRLGSFAGEVFSRAIFAIWLGDHPVQQSLKKALLGNG